MKFILSHVPKKTHQQELLQKNQIIKHTKKLTNNTKLGSFHHHRWTHQQAIFSLEAGTKVGPDQLGPPVRVGSTRIDSDQLGSEKKKKKNIKLDSDQLGAIKKI